MKRRYTTPVRGLALAWMSAGITGMAAEAQSITVQDVLGAWDNMAEMVIASAEMMPAEDYGFSPTEPLRNFADQMNHTSASNIGFGYAVNAGQPSFPVPDRADPPQGKDEVVTLLRASFAHFRGGLETLDDEDLSGLVPWGRAGSQRDITRLKAILIVTSHLVQEHGKTIMYLRAKGLTPPPSQGWTF